MLLYIIGLLLLGLALTVIAYPLFFHRVESYYRDERIDPRINERDLLLEAMSELELAYRSGKVNRKDYDRQNSEMKSTYIQLLESLENGSESQDSAQATPLAP